MKIQSGIGDFKKDKYVGNGRIGLSNKEMKKREKAVGKAKMQNKEKLGKWIEFFDMELQYKEMSLREKEKEVMDWIRKEIRYYVYKKGYNMFVGFSGGKDSLCTLDLVRRVQEEYGYDDIDIPAICADTLIMDKDVMEYIGRLNRDDKRWDIFVEKPLQDWFYYMREIRPPSSTARWCDKVCKVYPLWRRLRKKIDRDGWERNKVVGFMGSRGLEGYRRKYYGRVSLNKFLGLYNLYPIYYWSEKDVWGYIKKKELWYSPTYDEGQSRVGCMICPMNSNGKGEEDVDAKFYLEYMRELRRYKNKYGLDSDWVTSNLWRIWCSVNGKDVRRNVVGKRYGSLYEGLVYRFNKGVDVEKLERHLQMFKRNSRWKRLITWEIIEMEDGKSEMYVEYFWYGNKRLFRAFENQLLKGLNCINCGYCEVICPNVAIHVGKKDYVIDDKCDGCLKYCRKEDCIKLRFSNEINVIQNVKED